MIFHALELNILGFCGEFFWGAVFVKLDQKLESIFT